MEGKPDILKILGDLAQFGHAPEEGCRLFGVGYDDAFDRLNKIYLNRGFARGSSAEKFIVGPFGSGKTHFSHQLMEIAREQGCITAEVQLNKNIDFTKSLIVYRELTRNIRTPDGGKGFKNLIEKCIISVKSKVPDISLEDAVLSSWISGLDQVDFKLDTFKRLAKKAFLNKQNSNDEEFDLLTQWLSGEFDNKFLCKKLQIPVVSKSEENLFARRAMLSLFQLARHAGYKGTVVCFDEAEQGLTVDRKKTEKILSMLMSRICEMVDLERGSTLIIYAITPYLVEKMETLAALQQRISDPGGMSFFAGNTYAPLIRLIDREDPLRELEAIGRKLVELTYENYGEQISIPKESMIQNVLEHAKRIVEKDISASNRRDMVKATCSLLVNAIDVNDSNTVPTTSPLEEEAEV